jgi:dihydrofolate synthase/folylpolyglutamate synthase
LQTAKHKGRLEFYENFLFDGAHNIAGAKALKAFLDEFVSQPIIMIFGAMNDKDLSEISEILFTKASKLIFTEPNNRRSMKTQDLLSYTPDNFDEKEIFISDSVEKAIELAKKITKENELILVTGSLYLVGETQELLKNKSEI